MDFVNSSEVDVAYHVLTQAGQTMYYKDLVLDVIDKKRKPVQSLSAAISEVYQGRSQGQQRSQEEAGEHPGIREGPLSYSA